jgi:7-cyano-7-deazaguanine synthase in queuosine biosynthesis
MYAFADEECLYVDIGTRESVQERKLVEKHFPRMPVAEMPLAEYELGNHIIPFRNHMLALLGAQRASVIHFGFTLGDTSNDKDYVFAAQMEGLLRYFALRSDYLPSAIHGVYEIAMPTKVMTKAEILASFIEGGGDVEQLRFMSLSCYETEDGTPCGQCKACVRKHVALTLNSIDQTGWWPMGAPTLPVLQSTLSRAVQQGRGREIKEIQRCIDLRFPFQEES